MKRISSTAGKGRDSHGTAELLLYGKYPVLDVTCRSADQHDIPDLVTHHGAADGTKI
jgi:hypothetical protein